jgi:uncharacterized protein (UPF0179 family)
MSRPALLLIDSQKTAKGAVVDANQMTLNVSKCPLKKRNCAPMASSSAIVIQ